MFVTRDITPGVGFGVAQARLANLVHGSGLSGASQAAYKAGLARAIRVGPPGDMPGASKLVQVRFLDPVYRPEAMTAGLRWEATGPAGGLFPVLDADISLAPEGEQKTRLALIGAYRPPLGHVGAGLDRAILNRVATATIRALLGSIAGALASPRGAEEVREASGQRSRLADPTPAGT